MKLGSSRGMDTKRPRGSERSKPRHELQLTRPSQPPYPWPPEQAQPGVSKPCRTTLPLMPLLCGDNPLTNTAPSKFLRLTDYQLFILKQWADGNFIDDRALGWLPPDYSPFLPYPTTPPATGRALDRGILANVLGGSFCPGGEFGWIMRNPSAYWEPYRIKADRTTSDFYQSAAQANQVPTGPDVADFTYSMSAPLSQRDNFN